MSGYSLCPICKARVSSTDAIRRHLVNRHEISKRQARSFAMKLEGWKLRGSELRADLEVTLKKKGYSPGP